MTTSIELNEEWEKKYKEQATRLMRSGRRGKSVEEELHALSEKEVKKVLLPQKEIGIIGTVGYLTAQLVATVSVPFGGSYLCSKADNSRFGCSMWTLIGVDAIAAVSKMASAKPAINGSDVSETDASVFEMDLTFFADLGIEFFGEVVGDAIPFLNPVLKTIQLGKSRSEIIDNVVREGTCLHRRWISKHLDTLLALPSC